MEATSPIDVKKEDTARIANVWILRQALSAEMAKYLNLTKSAMVEMLIMPPVLRVMNAESANACQ